MKRVWLDPKEAIWGLHIHQELPLEDFKKSLVTQEACKQYLSQHNIAIDYDDVIAPGYGPHLQFLWELRIESESKDILRTLGLALSYMAINRFGLSAYIHPLMHDASLENDLEAEGLLNQPNALWFTQKIEQHQDFFFNPPRDEDQQIIDTRTSRLLNMDQRKKLLLEGKMQLLTSTFKDPYNEITKGFHIHLDYVEDQKELAMDIFENFIKYLTNINMLPTSTRHYAPKENGPHVLGGWEVKFETVNKDIVHDIGYAIGWLMCNRHGMPVFIHPVTWEEGDHQEEIRAHEEYAMFFDELPALDLDFFRSKIDSVTHE